MSALLATLSSSASTIAALQEKTVAEWIAMNQIVRTRLALTVPAIGTTEGDVLHCADGDWHWQQQITAVNEIPGLLSITVNVRRTVNATRDSSSANSFGSVSALGNTTGCVNTNAPGSSLGSAPAVGVAGALGAAGTSAASSTSSGSNTSDQNWLATLTGFRGNSLGAASGESPDWGGSTFAGNAGTNGIPTGAPNGLGRGVPQP